MPFFLPRCVSEDSVTLAKSNAKALLTANWPSKVLVETVLHRARNGDKDQILY